MGVAAVCVGDLATDGWALSDMRRGIGLAELCALLTKNRDEERVSMERAMEGWQAGSSAESEICLLRFTTGCQDTIVKFDTSKP